MVKDLKIDQIKNPLVDAVAAAYFIKGNKNVSGSDIKDIADYVAKTLKESFTTYRIPEVCQAIEMGARGDLFAEQDMNVVSPENIFKWIHRFNEKIRKEAIHKQKQHEEKIAKELEESQREGKIKEFECTILEIYQDFPNSFKTQNKGSLAAVYRHLDKKGLILLSEPVKWEIYKGIQKIKDRTKYAKKGFLEITSKELSEYRALKQVFKDWKEFDYDLKSDLNRFLVTSFLFHTIKYGNENITT